VTQERREADRYRLPLVALIASTSLPEEPQFRHAMISDVSTRDERAHMKLIKNCVLIPEVIFLRRQPSTLPAILNHLRSETHPQSMTA
jgi:hypothetical protein